jgi:hypothetical protein
MSLFSPPSPSDRVFAIAASVAVVLALATGFWLLGSPGQQRRLRSDQQRLQDLHAISEDLYFQAMRVQEQNTPPSLPETLPSNLRITDPLTQEPYVYRPLTETQYELCATFLTDSTTHRFRSERSSPGQEFWSHPQGEHCFQLDILQQAPYPGF